MTGTFEDSKGIVKWAANIRTRLANDSTRNAFKELAQVQGFLFLEEYLEEVQRGPTQSAVIEIAKTPGRKKDLPKKTRAAAAAASAKKLRIANTNDKENHVPASTLQQALLNAQKDKAVGFDDEDDRIQLSPKKRNPLSVSVVAPSQDDGRSPAPVEQPSASHHLSSTELAPPSLPIITEQAEKERRTASRVQPALAQFDAPKPIAPQPSIVPTVVKPVVSPLPMQPTVSARIDEKLMPSRIPTPTPSTAPESTIRPSTPIRSPLARATSPFASRFEDRMSGARSPSPSKAIKGTPGSPAFVTRIPRSPKLGFQVGSAPLVNPPRSPLALRKELAVSGPETTNSGASDSSNAPTTVRPSNAGDGVLPPAPKVRSSFLQRHPHDAPSLLGAGKKSMGSALAGKKSVAGPAALLTSTAGSKWKADLELVESAEKGFKPTKSTYDRESVADLQRKRKSEAEDEESYGNGMRKSKILKSSYGAPLRTAAAEFDSEDEHEDDEFVKLRETVGNLKRQKSLHMVDIDITTRLNVKIPPPSTAVESAPAPAPAIAPPLDAGSTSATQASSERSSRSHERLSISELMSSTESQKVKGSQVPSSVSKNSQPASNAPPAAAPSVLTKKEFTLLMASSNTSTTPPNSPPPSSLPPAAPKPRAQELATVAKAPYHQPAASGTISSQREATMLGVKSQIEPAANPQPLATATPTVLKATPASPLAAHALVANPFSKQTASKSPIVPSFTEIPADLFMPPPARPAQLQAPAPPPVTRQSSVTTISTQASYTDSIFSTQGSHGVANTQPTEYGLSQEALPLPVEIKAKVKPEEPVVPDAPKSIARPDSAMDQDERSATPASSFDDESSSQGEMQAGGPGLFAYASQFMSKAFGAGSAKKPKPEGHTKVFEHAAAAKKEQEEREKKKVERKEAMEARRLAVSQKKVEEDRARQQEHERKVKEEIERRKREREEMNASKLGGKIKKEEPEAKNRKITAEVERKPELKKQPSKDKLNSSFQAGGSSGLPRFNPPRPAPQPTTQQSSQPVAKTLVKKPSGNLASGPNPVPQSGMRGPSFTKLPPPGSMQPPEAGPSKPVKAFTGLAKKVPEPSFAAPAPVGKILPGKARPAPSMQVTLKNVVASEDIVLEEPNSEYSDSEDEDRNKDRPDWTRSPNLHQALQQQAHYNPDDIFGPIPQLDMGEMFPQRKFRPRSSSANWEGHALSKEEQIKYNEKMGYMGNIAE